MIKTNLSSFMYLLIALVFIACSTDDEDNMSVISVDGHSLYVSSASYTEAKFSNMDNDYIERMLYFSSDFITSKKAILDGYDLCVVFPIDYISEMKVGAVYSIDDFTVRSYRPLNSLYEEPYSWDEDGGTITVVSNSNSKVVLRFDNVAFSRKSENHVVDGIISYESSSYKD